MSKQANNRKKMVSVRLPEATVIALREAAAELNIKLEALHASLLMAGLGMLKIDRPWDRQR